LDESIEHLGVHLLTRCENAVNNVIDVDNNIIDQSAKKEIDDRFTTDD
jgi:hypothetical protein